MIEPFYIDDGQGQLLGVLHTSLNGSEVTLQERTVVVIAAPLLQEGISTYRSLWSLAEALSGRGIDVLRFDWQGSGDSSAGSRDIRLPGLVANLQSVIDHLESKGYEKVRMLAYRSAAIPLLEYFSKCSKPVSAILWDPEWIGGEVAVQWQLMHGQQVKGLRYGHAHSHPDSATEDLLGFSISPEFIDEISRCGNDPALLPAGSQLLLAAWENTGSLVQLRATQESAGVMVEYLQLEPEEKPDWQAPQIFEDQVFPRRSVQQLATHIASRAVA